MKRIASAILASTFLVMPSFATFSDVSETYWGYSAINRMQEANILTGYEDGSFKPNNNITLAEFAVIFTKIFEIPQDSVSNYFTDIPTPHWAKGYVEAIREYMNPYYDSIGEAIGVTDYSYLKGLPGDIEMTREAFIYAVSRIYGYSEDLYTEGEEKTLFADYDEIIYPKEIVMAYKNNVISGEVIGEKTYIRPNRCITRAEASAIFNNLLKYENTRVNNKNEDAQLNAAFSDIIKNLKENGVSDIANIAYDTRDVLKSDNFIIDESKKETLNEICNLFFENFEYEIIDRGFYSFNRGYLKVKVKGYDIPNNLGELTSISNSDIEELKNNILESSIIEKEEVLNFAKKNGEWKLILK